MTRRILFPACCALSLGVGMAADLAKLQSIGPVSSFQRTAQGVVIECADRSQVRIDLLAADLVRVRAAFRRELTDHGSSWAIANTSWPVPKWNLSDSAEFLSLITEEIEVRVRRSPLLVSFADPRTHQAITADERPMAYDPASSTIATIRKLGFDEHIYGLGEKAARLDKRRGSFTMWNTDAYRYKEGTDPLYQSIPFYIAWQDGAAYGLFYDNSFRTHFDFGAATETLTTFVAEGGPMDYYFFQGPSMKKILGRYADLTGHMPMPPAWTLGHQQSRYAYYPDSRVQEVAEAFRKHDLPLDGIHLDIAYMNSYRLFTWDTERFPDPGALTAKLRQQGVKLVAILDPGIKYQPEASGAPPSGAHPELSPQDKNYYVYQQGAAHDYFLKRKDGRLYIGRVWPDEAVFVDYTVEKAARWWGDLLRAYTDHGVAGIWTDMNEPSDFVDQTGDTQMDVITGRWGPAIAVRWKSQPVCSSHGTSHL